MGASKAELWIVTGKGGVGKTTIAAALGWRLAEKRRTLLLEVDPRESLHAVVGSEPSGGKLVEVAPGLRLQNLRPRDAIDQLVERRLPLGSLLTKLRRSAVYEQFVEGCPGLEEVAVLGHALDVIRSRGRRSSRTGVVVLDAPATGHALALLEAPRLLGEVIDRGPVGELAAEVASWLADAARTRVVAVTTAEEMPVTETLELRAALEERLGRTVDHLVVNGLYPASVSRAGRRGRTREERRALDLLRHRRAGQRRQLARLQRQWPAPLVRCELVPLDPGRALCAALGDDLEALL